MCCKFQDQFCKNDDIFLQAKPAEPAAEGEVPAEGVAPAAPAEGEVPAEAAEAPAEVPAESWAPAETARAQAKALSIS